MHFCHEKFTRTRRKAFSSGLARTIPPSDRSPARDFTTFQYGCLSGVRAALSNETRKQCLLKGHNRAFMCGHLPRENNQLCSEYLYFVVHWMPNLQVFCDWNHQILLPSYPTLPLRKQHVIASQMWVTSMLSMYVIQVRGPPGIVHTCMISSSFVQELPSISCSFFTQIWLFCGRLVDWPSWFYTLSMKVAKPMRLRTICLTH